MNQTRTQPLTLRLPANLRGRDFVVGALRGHRSALQALLQAVRFDPSRDRLMGTGGLVGFGQENEACLALLEEPWFYTCFSPSEAVVEDKALDFSTSRLQKLERLPFILAVAGEGSKAPFQVVHGELLDRAPLHRQTVEEETYEDTRYTREQTQTGKELAQDWRAGRPIRRRHASDMGVTFGSFVIVPQPCRLGQQIYLNLGAGYSRSRQPEEEDLIHAGPLQQTGLALIEAQTLETRVCPIWPRGPIQKQALLELDAY